MPTSISINPTPGETAEKPRISVLPGFDPKPVPKPKPIAPEPVTFRAFDDYGAIRKRILDGVLRAATEKYPLSNSRYTLHLHEPKYDSVESFSLQDQKHAIIHGDSLEHKLTGTWRLTDNATGKVVDEKKSVIAHVPHMTDRGTFILNGTDFTVANQMRLKPGVYSRVKDNGLIEAHVNVKPGTGPSFRIHMEPDTGIFRLAVRQSNLKLYPILRAMGVDDKEIEKSWGRDLLQKNMEAEDPRAVARAFASLVNQRASASAETAEGLKGGEEEEKSAGLFDDPEYERRCSEGSRETRDLFDVPKEVWDHLQVKKSSIQGNGLFTKCAFAPGGKVIPAFVHSAESGDPYSDYRRSIPARWLNHSEMPNTKLALDGSALWIVADKEIKAGEELTGDYQTLPDCIRSLMQAPVDPHFQLEWSDGVKAAGSVSPIVPLVESLDDVAAYMMLRNRPRMKGIRTPDVSTMAGLMGQDEEKKKQQIANAPPVMDPVPTPEKAAKSAASAIGGEDNTGIKVDPHELAMGIEVEKEHTPRVSIARQIAFDHLAEIPTYYTLLKRMEANAKKTEKEAQIGAKASDRKWSQLWFRGKLVDSEKDGKHWVLLEIHRGLCEAAYKSLREEGVDCEPRFSNPHISVLREEEVDQLKKKFKHNWKGVAKVGQPMRFRLTRLVNLVPRGWAEMDRVWFIECESPELMEYRHDLGFQSLPQSPDSGHEMRFHITFAVHRNTVKKAETEFLKFAAETDMSALSTRPQSIKPGDHGPQLLDVFNRMELDPEVTETTLGERHQNAGIPFILSTTRKLLKINAGKADVDDRDSLAFQTLHGPEDLFAERIHRDAGQTGRKLLWRSTLKGNVQHIPTGALSAQLRSVFLRSGMGQSIEESNPLDVYDQNLRVSRLGEGAMPGIESVPAEARNVQPSHFGFLDPIRSPEGPKIGVDSRVTHGTMKGSDGQFYTTMINARTGKPQLVSALQASKSTVAFPGEMEKGNQQLRAMVKSRQVEYVHKNDVDFILPSHNQMFHPISNLTPMIGSLDGGRLLMGSKFSLQALPLRDPEAPLVQTLHESGKSFHELLGEKAGALRAKKAGVVTDIGPGHMTVRYIGGEKVTHELFSNFPFNRRSVSGDTEIIVRSLAGYFWRGPIANYLHQAGDRVLSVDPITKCSSWKRILAYWKYKNMRKLLRISFASGRAVVVTEDHSLITMSDRGELTPIYPRDCVINKTRSPIASMNLSGTVDPALSYDLGLFVGLYLSEGHCPAAQPNLIVIAVKPDGRAREIIQVLNRLKTERKAYRNGGSVNVSDFALSRWLQHEFKRLSHGKTIPAWVFNAPIAFREGLIAGYMGGDGCLWSDGNGAVQLAASSVSESLRDGLCGILSSLGIATTMFLKKTKLKNHRIGFGFRVLASHISKLRRWFFYADRQRKLCLLVKKKYRASPYENVPIINRAARLKLYTEFKERPSMLVYKTASLGFVAKHRLKGCNGVFGRWGSSDVVWDTIIAIDEAEHEEYVFDLSVEESENFAVCSGLIVHNTFIHNTPAVKIGDQVSPGQLLAKSNFTDAKGTLALGANFRTAYMVHHGNTFEDAIVISESAAKRLSSEHMYQHVFDPEDSKEAGRKQFLSMFPTVYKKEQIAGINEHGVVKPGTVVHQGDPLVLALQRNKATAVHRGHRPMFSDATETWEHGFDGVVTDVEKTKEGGWNVTVKAYAPMQEGDKLAAYHGDKGVVSKILPDGHMPHTKDGKAMEILLNPLGVISRGNPSQVFEALLGKVARKKGQAYKIPTFSKDSVHDFVHKELKDNGLSDTEDLTDPTSGRKIPSVLTGERFLMKLHHTSESKGRGRDVGAYTSEGLPARGGMLGSKRIASMEMNALLSHGATEVIRDAQVVRGQRNDDFWRAFKMGQTPPIPKVPFIYEKFMGFMKGAGINIKKQGDKLHLMALRDQDIDELSNGEITNKHTVTGDRMEEVPGGLFDRTVTGGHAGSKWAHIPLFEPMPNPVMEEPIRQLLDLTKHEFEEVLSGKKPLHGKIGGAAIAEALSKLNVDSAIEYNEGLVRDGSKGKRDEAVKSLGYLKALQKTGIKPSELMLSKVPVIPPSMRPITGFKKMLITADPNLLYRDLMAANDGLKQASEVLSPEHVGQERLMLYNAFKAVTGLGDPVQSKTQQKQVKGLLAHVFGPGSPKYGLFQRRVMGAPVDIVGRATVTPNSDMDMDHVGLPEKQAWTIYRPFITRRLVRRGMPAVQAAKAVAGQTDVARKAMIEEMEERPVLINRAPTLHRYGFMAAWPILTKNDTLQVSPITTAGFGMDFDGDNANYHVPVSEDAVKDAIDKMMPSRNLRAVRDFKVHYMPRNEFLLGLHLASSGDNGNEPRVFKDRASALAAYKRGEIDVRDRIVIKE